MQIRWTLPGMPYAEIQRRPTKLSLWLLPVFLLPSGVEDPKVWASGRTQASAWKPGQPLSHYHTCPPEGPMAGFSNCTFHSDALLEFSLAPIKGGEACYISFGEELESFYTVRILRDFNLLSLAKGGLLDEYKPSFSEYMLPGTRTWEDDFGSRCLFCAKHECSIQLLLLCKSIVNSCCSVFDHPLQQSSYPFLTHLSGSEPICCHGLARVWTSGKPL